MSELPHLDALDQRILGSLMEKQVTVPSTYPLSLNALRTACNQTSSRDPISEYDDQELTSRCRELKDRGLLRIVWADTGRRTLKYHQTLDDLVTLSEAERAILTVLLLRGASAPGELRSRTERLHVFADRSDVETILRAMADRGLVRQLERRPGDRDRRWVHLLGEVASATEERDVAGPLTLPVEPGTRDEKVRATYEAVAERWGRRFETELDRRPFERWLLERLSDLAGPHPVADVGCGTGHVTAHLHDLGVDVTGFDLTPAMVDQARRLHPDIDFEVADLRQLMRPRNDDGWGAVVAHYALVHFDEAELPGAVAALARVLRADGWLLLGLHVGPFLLHSEVLLDVPVDVDFVAHDPVAVRRAVAAAGLVDVSWWIRGRDEAAGETTDRFYLVARKP